ncbi:MAG: Rv2175c family DNA-binding protein [bacterium]|nr:Rv2175c family DNA-binding protein [bacterium]
MIDPALDPSWLPVPDAAELLGIQFRTLRNQIRDGELVTVRVEGLEGARIPSAFIHEGAEGPELVDGLRGSVTQLRDSGMDDEALTRWLLEPNEELGMSPAAALAAGQKHAVRRAALALAL